jgi:hypothetical protein
MDALELIEVLNGIDIPAIAREALAGNTERIADLNAGQLAQGVRSTGSEILPEYRGLTIEIKRGKSGLAAVTDHVTLFDTGAFYRSLYAQVMGDEIEYGARDEKAEKLAKKYKPTIFGLTLDSRDDLTTHYLSGDTIEIFREQTGL